jgi:putative acetyltransferase
MLVRTHRNGDIPDISRLYYDTIHRVNSGDYSREQVDAWAPAVPTASFWKERFKKYRVYVAEEEGHVVGFTELDPTGHIDCFFVHHEWQRRGVGAQLMDRVMKSAARTGTPRLFAEVSITAVPFFRRQGFVVVRENEAVRSNVKLKQFAMERWLTA